MRTRGVSAAPPRALALAALAASLACGAAGPRPCAGPADCPLDAYCHEGTCRANAPPRAVIALPAQPKTFLKLAFDGSGSFDPDPGDAVETFAWSVSVANASCLPLPAGGAGAVFETVFKCSGEFDVDLVVSDRFGTPSAPARVRLGVPPSLDPPVVTAGPRLELDHRCAGSPLVCTPADALGAGTFRLGATAASVAPGPFAFHWSVEQPPGADPAARVSFDPGPDDPNPVVTLETDGGAIAGTWRFLVEATDVRGLTDVGVQEVLVRNRPPQIAYAGPSPIVVPHVYEAANRRFAAHGQTPVVSVSDPDGDPIVARGFSRASAGDGGNTFSISVLPDQAVFDVYVAYGAPSDAAFLIGPGVSRSIRFSATDANGETAAADWEVVVANRKPRLVSAVAQATVAHVFDAAASRYLATAALSSFADDDGDPLAAVATGDPKCVGKEAAGGRAVVECSHPYAGTPAVNDLAGDHLLDAGVADPWESTTSPARVTVTNLAPTQVSSSVNAANICTPKTCCVFDPELKRCVEWYTDCTAGSASAPFPFGDPEGDPVQVVAVGDGCASASLPAGGLCVPGSCGQARYDLCAASGVCGGVSGQVSLTATDGQLSASGIVTVY